MAGEMNKAIFSYNSDISKNAYLNWRTCSTDVSYNLFILAEGFSSAADILIGRIIKENREKIADLIIFPILYAIDQSIELYLKAIIRIIEELNGCGVSNYKTHDIQNLLKTMISLIQKNEASTKDLSKHLKPVETYIDELYGLIKTEDAKGKSALSIDFARYPIDTAGNPHFYVKSMENVVIDIENLAARNVEIKESLEAIYCRFENKEEGR